MNRDKAIAIGLAATLDQPNATLPGMDDFKSSVPEDVTDATAIVTRIIDALNEEQE